jgi:WD40 repeat protein
MLIGHSSSRSSCLGYRLESTTFAECIASMGNTYSEPLRLWDIQTGRLKAERNDKRVGGGRPIVLSPNGTTLAVGGKSVHLCDVRTGNKLHRLQGIMKKIQAIAFSPDGRLVYAAGNYGTTNVWDVASRRLMITLFTFADTRNETGKDDWLAYRPDGSYDGSTGADRYVAWRAGDELRTASSHGNRRSGVRIEAAYGAPSKQSTP